ncbi:hypothetical protein [Chroococcidiopsis sp. CCMEE 29]|uniref:hypothetical protein n=1 Tax=Chroococcidiopsis sp. CCMEE 29 TaxID=155894 RepID=UPI0020202402|nr:hypothetical protein [Chroococcidiopsis sp. CCMEE 29]
MDASCHVAPSCLTSWENWPKNGRSLLRCIAVERQGVRGGQAFTERQFYISSVATTTQQFHALIRGHWTIENQLSS